MADERSAELLLSDLTPGGSEFTTPQRCFEWARDRLANAQQQAVRAHAEKNRLRDEVARLSALNERLLAALDGYENRLVTAVEYERRASDEPHDWAAARGSAFRFALEQFREAIAAARQ